MVRQSPVDPAHSQPVVEEIVRILDLIVECVDPQSVFPDVATALEIFLYAQELFHVVQHSHAPEIVLWSVGGISVLIKPSSVDDAEVHAFACTGHGYLGRLLQKSQLVEPRYLFSVAGV